MHAWRRAPTNLGAWHASRTGMQTTHEQNTELRILCYCVRSCHSNFGPGDFGPAGPKSPENTAGISVRGTIITRDIGPVSEARVTPRQQ